MKELTDKTWGLQTRSFGIIWLTEEEATSAKAALAAGVESLDFGDVLVMRGDIAGFASGSKLEGVERKKRGDFECDYGYWHTRGDQCGHHLVPGAKKINNRRG